MSASHRIRRAALAPFFSKQKIASITDYVSSKVQRLCDRLETEYKGRGDPVNLNQCLTALTFDITTYYAFAHSFEYLERPGFNAPFTDAAKGLATSIHVMGHFPWLLACLQSLPRSLSLAMNPLMGPIFAFHEVL
jgi:cytochrome P450